jgi:hypothetical protein
MQLHWLKKRFQFKKPSQSFTQSTAHLRAQELIAAIDQGGIPLNPMIINRIGRDLGLEVLPSAPMPETIERIRAQLLK